jgi:hypothetical protein
MTQLPSIGRIVLFQRPVPTEPVPHQDAYYPAIITGLRAGGGVDLEVFGTPDTRLVFDVPHVHTTLPEEMRINPPADMGPLPGTWAWPPRV